MPTYADMRKRQRVLANFGEFALRSDDLGEVLNEALRLVRAALHADYGKVLEIDQKANEAVVVAGHGWPQDIVGRVRLSLDENSSEAFAIEEGGPTVSTDISEEDRFHFPDFMIEAGVVSLINVPIFLPGGRPYGLLQVDHKEKSDFDQENIEFLRTYSTILGPVIDRLHKSHDLRIALREQETLMDEMQHRVKNNIGMIASLLRLRERNVASADAKAELRLVAGRVDTLAFVHDHLYANAERRDVVLGDYLEEMLNALLELNDAESRGIECRVDAEEVRLSADQAVPLGLIANEFATNSLKHAFGEEGGTITLNLEVEASTLRLTLADDGRGLPNDGEQDGTRRGGTGLRLMEGVAQQIGARLHRSAVERGTMFVVELDQ